MVSNVEARVGTRNEEIIMKKLFVMCLLAMAAAQAPAMAHAEVAAGATAVAGTLLFSEDGHQLGPVYKVAEDGSAKLIVEGKMVTVPANTLSGVDGKLTTTLTKRQVYSLTR
jgi:hypothetical protein